MSQSASHRPLDLTSPRRPKPPRHWFDLDASERVAAVARFGLPAFRARQINVHTFVRHELDPGVWTDFSQWARSEITAVLPELLTVADERFADGGTTVKTAWRLFDGLIVESVLMRYPDRVTLCISSQAGCGMACPFCATGQLGLQRNLSAAEIVLQVALLAGRLERGEFGAPGHLHNIVFMGMGEPLANYRASLSAIRTIIGPAPDGLGMSGRGITVSTVGLVPRIRQLTEEGLPVTLAVSLHAPSDELRDRIIPANQHWRVGEVLDAAWDYARTTHRRVSIEYALIRELNDQVEQARELARQLHARGDWAWAHVNLIPLNPVPNSIWTAAAPGVLDAFYATLERAGIPVSVRDTRGADIDGACGQLAAHLQ